MFKRRATFRQLTRVYAPLWMFPFVFVLGAFVMGKTFIYFGAIPLFCAATLWMALASAKIKISIIDMVLAGLIWMLSGTLSIIFLFVISQVMA